MRNRDWIEQAACRGMALRPSFDPSKDPFFPKQETRESYETGKSICARCPVKASCEASETMYEVNGRRHGLFALTPVERERKRRTGSDKTTLDVLNDRRWSMVNDGWSDQMIADHENVTREAIKNWRIKNGLGRGQTPQLEAAQNLMRQTAYDQGMADGEIAEACNTSRGAIQNWRRRRKLKPNGQVKTLSKDDRAERLHLYSLGMVDSAIADRVGVEVATITRWRHRAGLEANGTRVSA